MTSRREHFRLRSTLGLALLLPVVTLTACAGRPSPAAVPPAAEAGAARDITLDPYLRGLRTLDVTVAGETLPFLFDTAGGVTLVTPEVAARAGCEPFGQGVGFRHNGEPVTLERCRGVEIAIAGHPTRDEELAVWDLMAVLQGAPVVGGIVSLKSFEGETITLDLAGGSLRVESESGLERTVDGMTPIRVRDARQAGGAALDLFVAIEAPEGPLWFELDSGSVSPVLVSPQAAELLGLDLAEGEPREVDLPVAGLGTVRTRAQAKEDLIYDGLLGAAFLEELVVTMDLDGFRAWARKR